MNRRPIPFDSSTVNNAFVEFITLPNLIRTYYTIVAWYIK